MGVVRALLIDLASLSPIAVGACPLFAGCLSGNQIHFTAVLTKLHLRMKYALDDLPALQN